MDLLGFLPSFGNFLWTALAFVVALSVIVAIHEYGHYIVGRWSGIHAEVFSLGFGPRLWSGVDRRGTRWQIAALPFGGYVKFLGDANAASAGADDATMARLSPAERRHTMHGAPLWARAATVAAGPVFNFILSVLVFTGLFLWQGTATETPTVGEMRALPGGPGGLQPGDQIVKVGGIPVATYEELVALIDKQPSAPGAEYSVRRDGADLTVEGPVLYPARAESITPGSAAFDAGLQKGDVITAADGVALHTFGDLQKAVKAAEGRPLTLGVWRAGSADLKMSLAPRVTDVPKKEGGFETRYLIGLTGDFSFAPATEPLGPVDALTAAAAQTWFIAKVLAVRHRTHHHRRDFDVQPARTARHRGNLGCGSQHRAGRFHLVHRRPVHSCRPSEPVPDPDARWRASGFHAWEWATGRPPSDRVLNVAMSIGLALVLGLMVFGLTNDVLCP